MSNWDLMMPGMGLTSLGLAGVVISYAGIAHTFIDGMHALTGLTMFVGLIFLSAGVLEGGVSTSNRAKATVLVVAAISLSFGTAGFVFNTVSTVPTFAAVMLILVTPAVVIAYVATKMPQYTRPVGLIFALAAVAGVGSFVAFGFVGPGTYLVPEEPEEELEEPAAAVPEGEPFLAVSILEGSDAEGAPDYEPDAAAAERGMLVVWTNDDDAFHTVTSSADGGKMFDSGMMAAGGEFILDTSDIPDGEHEYLCLVHPWMISTLTVTGGAGGGGGISPAAEG